jgi:alpha-tubulin suppressor-like RCC1 family protein
MSRTLNEPTTFAWGKNKDGELSIGGSKDSYLPIPVKGVKNKNIIHVSSGGQHSAAIDNQGRLYICGSYLHGKLGIEDLTTVSVQAFTLVPSLKDKVVIQVACGDYHTLCLLEDGSVYTWGGTLHKKLGQRSGKAMNKPGLVQGLSEKEVIYVGCGDFHSVALTSDGKVYTWGGGGSFFNRGQCGHGHVKDILDPLAIPAFANKKIVQLSCGGYHTLALTESNDLYAWGSGLYGECGFGEFLNTSSPKLVLFPWVKNGAEEQQIVQISAGGHHSLALTEHGYVFSFGFASHGQLGLRNTINQSEPQLVTDLRNKPIKSIAAGWNHTLVLTERGDVFSCGYGFFGQLGHGDDESKTIFTHVTALGPKNVERIYAGGNHSWALLDPADPIKREYYPPSPLPSDISIIENPIDFNSLIQREDTYEFSSKLEITTKIDYALQVAYSDIQFCHRFVRYKLKDDQLDMGKAKTEEFVHEMYINEAGLQYHRIQEDDDIIEITGGTEETICKGAGSSITCLLVCDPCRNEPGMEKNDDTLDNEEITVVLKPSQLVANPLQTGLSEWVRFFMNKVAPFCIGIPKFFELRPKHFYTS